MALHTPRRLPGRSPSLAQQHLTTAASSPNLSLAASTAIARKASLNALNGVTSPSGDMAFGEDIELGDIVDVPGGMHGTVRFIGSVRGKKGVFAGVELSKEFAARGKNDGDVDGTFYFTTNISGAGIFLPLHRASKRGTRPFSANDTSPSPNFSSSTIGLSTNGSSRYSPPTPSIPKFSQSVGPGARAPSPINKGRSRPSGSRPESPIRKTPVLTPGRTPSAGGPALFSKSAIGAPRFITSPVPGKPGVVKPRTPGPSRPYSRNNSRLGHHNAIDEDSEFSLSINRNSDGSADLTPRKPTAQLEEEIRVLTKKLEERDKQLKDQASSLSDMEASLGELQTLIAENGDLGPDDADVVQLRAILREKNEKISILTTEFDAHRADFRSTIDTLELASTETVRVYEKKVSDLMEEIAELQERGEDVESVARQLKQLEDLVQELEEGLEDARRGEAEARGEVEFLRGEVERGRSELRREREKAAAALKGAGAAMDGSKDLAQRDDEIRGLKAIIHSLSSGAEAPGSPALKNGNLQIANNEELEKLKQEIENHEREKGELRGLIERKAFREEELERELERLRQQSLQDGRTSVISNGMSERTAVQDKRSSARDSKGTMKSWHSAQQQVHKPLPLEPMLESDTQSSADGSILWCEICETGGHDILNCTAMGNTGDLAKLDVKRTRSDTLRSASDIPEPLSSQQNTTQHKASSSPGKPPSAPLPPTAPLPNPYDSSLVAGKGASEPDPQKWCALCERDGHDATACPFEDAF